MGDLAVDGCRPCKRTMGDLAVDGCRPCKRTMGDLAWMAADHVRGQWGT